MTWFLSTFRCVEAMNMFLQNFGHRFVKHPALWYSSSRPFTMDRLPYVHKSQKNIRAPPGLPRQDFQSHTKKQNMYKGIKSKEKVAVMGPLSSLCCDYKIMPSISIKFGGGKIFSLHK